MNKKKNRENYRILGFRFVLLAAVVLSVNACVTSQHAVVTGEDTIKKQESVFMRPQAANVTFSWMQLPADVDIRSFSVFKLSSNGKILIGNASLKDETQASSIKPLQAFRWNLADNQWLWLDNLKYENGAALMGMDSTGDRVFGAQWVWQKNAPEIKALNQNFWAYILRDDGYFIGAGLNSSIMMISMDGSVQKSWPVEDVLRLDNRGNLEDTLLFSDSGTVISSTMEQCLQDNDCEQATLTRWTPEQGSSALPVQIPERPEAFFQSHAGPQLVSQNGKWLAGSVGQGIYLWDVQGQMKFLGAFDNGGTVVSLSNDGKMAVGYTTGNQSKLARSWIWTETEGLGWLDEWLRNHGVAAENISKIMQVQLLSPDRRVMIGFTPPEDTLDSQAQSHWWKVDLSEHLRVLI